MVRPTTAYSGQFSFCFSLSLALSLAALTFFRSFWFVSSYGKKKKMISKRLRRTIVSILLEFSLENKSNFFYFGFFCFMFASSNWNWAYNTIKIEFVELSVVYVWGRPWWKFNLLCEKRGESFHNSFVAVLRNWWGQPINGNVGWLRRTLELKECIGLLVIRAIRDNSLQTELNFIRKRLPVPICDVLEINVSARRIAQNRTATKFDIGFRVWNTELFIYLVEILYFIFARPLFAILLFTTAHCSRCSRMCSWIICQFTMWMRASIT